MKLTPTKALKEAKELLLQLIREERFNELENVTINAITLAMVIAYIAKLELALAERISVEENITVEQALALLEKRADQ